MKCVDITKLKPAILGYLFHGVVVWMYLWVPTVFFAAPLNLYLHEGLWVWPTVDFAISAGRVFLVAIVIYEIFRWIYERRKQ